MATKADLINPMEGINPQTTPRTDRAGLLPINPMEMMPPELLQIFQMLMMNPLFAGIAGGSGAPTPTVKTDSGMGAQEESWKKYITSRGGSK